MIERLFRVDPFAEFTVCERCMGFVEFGTWLDWLVEGHAERERRDSDIDWKVYGF